MSRRGTLSVCRKVLGSNFVHKLSSRVEESGDKASTATAAILSPLHAFGSTNSSFRLISISS